MIFIIKYRNSSRLKMKYSDACKNNLIYLSIFDIFTLKKNQLFDKYLSTDLLANETVAALLGAGSFLYLGLWPSDRYRYSLDC